MSNQYVSVSLSIQDSDQRVYWQTGRYNGGVTLVIYQGSYSAPNGDGGNLSLRLPPAMAAEIGRAFIAQAAEALAADVEPAEVTG